VNYFAKERGSKRAVDMLLKKISGKEFETEYPMPVFDRVDPQPAVKDMTKAKVALVSSGGPVPKGNPDRIEASSASKYGKYNLTKIDDFTAENGETAHGGYDPVYANIDLDRVLPVDVIKEMVKAGEIGSLHDYWYSTVGNGTAVANSKAFGAAIAEELRNDNVDCVILTST
jgi:glycine reductase